MWELLFHVAKTDPTKFTSEQFKYVKELDILIGFFQKIPTNQRVTPYITHRSLILPIRILNRKYKSLPFVRELNDRAMEVSTYYQEMELLLRHTRIQYQEYLHTVRTIQKTNEMVIKILG